MYEKAINSVTQRYGRDYPFEVKSKFLIKKNENP